MYKKNTTQHGRIFLAKTAHTLSPLVDFILASVVLAVALDIIANVVSPIVPLPSSWLNHLKSAFEWGFQNPLIISLLCLILVLLRLLFFLVRDIPIPLSNRKLASDYLHSMKMVTEELLPEGLPTSIKGLSAMLKTIYSSPDFYPNTPMTDLPANNNEILEDYLLLENKNSWLEPHDENKRIDFSALWRRFSKDRPVAVILGYPGMGKSTLLAGLTFHLAQKNKFVKHISELRLLSNSEHSLKSSDSIVDLTSAFQDLQPLLFPILLNLRDYAQFIDDEENSNITIESYLQMRWREHFLIIQAYLKEGKCIVLFDGLDEVSKGIRLQVQRDINSFIKKYKRNQLAFYNRFIITSRAACFDHNAFPDVGCYFYVLAPLTSTQIEQLLTHYCRAFFSNNPAFYLRQNEVMNEAKKRAKSLTEAINSNQSLKELACNPLLLYLLVVILFRKEKVDFPSQRIELFEVATNLLLEGHSESRSLPKIEENLAINCLGYLAVTLQSESRKFMPYDEVIRSLMHSMKTNVEKDAENFLERIRERSGLFVRRVGNEYGFYHQTFQEYFAARFLIRSINDRRKRSLIIKDLVAKGCLVDRGWWEPFLLAVAYLSHKDRNLTNRIVRELLQAFDRADKESKFHIISLAEKCIYEVKPLSVERNLTDKIALLIEKVRNEPT